jgi:lactate permease
MQVLAVSFIQHYTPVADNVLLSALVAALPIVVLLGLLGLLRAAFGLFPIGWIVLCAIFVYDITVKTGRFEEVRHTIAGLAVDPRIQVLLIAFSFGAFIEGAAGFGTPSPVALTGSDTSSNALFGSLQKITATQIGISPVLAAASTARAG